MISFIQIAAAVLAIIFVMILHELPKAIVYNMSIGKKDSISDIFHIIRYVDPIGVIFAIATGAGFSKPYRYKIESKKQALAIGITGFSSLLLQFLAFVILYKACYTGTVMEVFIQTSGYLDQFMYWFISLVIMYSLGMFFVNLMPIAAFNMGMIVAGVSLPNYIAMLRRDTEMKIVLFIVLILEAIPISVIKIVNLI